MDYRALAMKFLLTIVALATGTIVGVVWVLLWPSSFDPLFCFVGIPGFGLLLDFLIYIRSHVEGAAYFENVGQPARFWRATCGPPKFVGWRKFYQQLALFRTTWNFFTLHPLLKDCDEE